jgi:mutual gliding-motility protein MglA
MSFVNEETKEVNCKVVYFGPAQCGKSTSLRSIYNQVKAGAKGDMISLATDEDRTLFFDFVPLYLGMVKGFAIRVHLYTVPGQAAYDAQRSLIAKGTDGVVFVADSQIQRMESNLSSLGDLEKILAAELGDESEVDEFPMVLQYNKRDLPQAAPLPQMRDVLNKRRVPDFESIATNDTGVFDALKAISAQVLQSLG